MKKIILILILISGSFLFFNFAKADVSQTIHTYESPNLVQNVLQQLGILTGTTTEIRVYANSGSDGRITIWRCDNNFTLSKDIYFQGLCTNATSTFKEKLLTWNAEGGYFSTTTPVQFDIDYYYYLYLYQNWYPQGTDFNSFYAGNIGSEGSPNNYDDYGDMEDFAFNFIGVNDANSLAINFPQNTATTTDFQAFQLAYSVINYEDYSDRWPRIVLCMGTNETLVATCGAGTSPPTDFPNYWREFWDGSEIKQSEDPIFLLKKRLLNIGTYYAKASLVGISNTGEFPWDKLIVVSPEISFTVEKGNFYNNYSEYLDSLTALGIEYPEIASSTFFSGVFDYMVKRFMNTFPLSVIITFNDAIQELQTSSTPSLILSGTGKIFGGKSFTFLSNSTLNWINNTETGFSLRSFLNKVMYAITGIIIIYFSILIIISLTKPTTPIIYQ